MLKRRKSASNRIALHFRHYTVCNADDHRVLLDQARLRTVENMVAEVADHLLAASNRSFRHYLGSTYGANERPGPRI